MGMSPWTFYQEKCGIESIPAQAAICVATTAAAGGLFAGGGALLSLATGASVLAGAILFAPAGAAVAGTYMLTSLLMEKGKMSMCAHTTILTVVSVLAIGGTLAAGIVLGILSTPAIIAISVIAGLGLLFLGINTAIQCFLGRATKPQNLDQNSGSCCCSKKSEGGYQVIA